MAESTVERGTVERGTVEPGRRERKKQRTKEQITAAAYRLFGEQGYERTTIADIAAAADVSQGTFFNHFPTKEAVLFADRSAILETGLRAVAGRGPDESSIDVLVRAVVSMLDEPHFEPNGERERQRIELVMGVPSLRGTMLQRMFDVQHRLAEALREGDPDGLGELEAVALVGAIMGAATAAVQTALEAGLPLDETLKQAVGYLANHLRPTA